MDIPPDSFGERMTRGAIRIFPQVRRLQAKQRATGLYYPSRSREWGLPRGCSRGMVRKEPPKEERMTKLPIAILAAAALWSCGAEAKTVSISFDGFCNGLDITTARDKPVIKSVENGCAAGQGGGRCAGRPETLFRQLLRDRRKLRRWCRAYIGEEFWVISRATGIGRNL